MSDFHWTASAAGHHERRVVTQLMYTGADSDGNEGRPLLCATAKRKLTEIHKEAKKV